MGKGGERTKRSGKSPPADLKTAVNRRTEEGLPWRRTFGFLMRRMLEHPFALAFALILSIGIALVDVFSLALFVPFLGALTGTESALAEATPLGFLIPFFEGLSTAGKIRMVAALLVASQLLGGVFLYLLGRNAQYLHLEVGRSVRLMLFDDLMRVEMRFINKERASNLFTLLHSFPNAASKIVDQILIGMQNAARFIALGITLVLVSWQLTILAAGLSVVATLITVQMNKSIRRQAGVIKTTRLRLHATTLETLNSMKVMHLFGRTGYMRNRFFGQLTQHQDQQYRQAAVTSLVQPAYAVLNMMLLALVLVGATYIIAGGADVWVSQLAIFLAVMLRFASQSGRYAKRRAAIVKELPEMEAILEFQDRKDKSYLRSGHREFQGLRDSVSFENVRFRYENDEPWVIDDVSFTIPRGKMVAIIGGSGAGKSTIVDLLARLYDPQDGRIAVDGHDLREYRTGTWRRHLAVVSQDAFLFNDTLRENIRFGRLDATDAEIEDAARQANAHEFIQELPQGYDTPMGDRGVRLSGGQAQRIIIARAILADPDVLVLDEATSALDTQTEHLVQAAIERASVDRTIVAIAHRLSTVRKADSIIVMEKGRLVEQGTHDELLARKGAYWRYVQMQDLTEERERQAAHEVPVVPATAPDDGDRWLASFVVEGNAQTALAGVRDVQGVESAWAERDRVTALVRAPAETVARIFEALHKAGIQVPSFDTRIVNEDAPPIMESGFRGSAIQVPPEEPDA